MRSYRRYCGLYIKRKKLISSSVTGIFIVFFILSHGFECNVKAEVVDSPSIELDPQKIDIMVTKNEMVQVPKAILYITARQANLVKISINSTDLYEEQNRRFWIPADSISFSKNRFNLTEGQTASVNIVYTFKENLQPGIYKGRIIVRSDNGGKVELPITISLRLVWWIPFLLVSLGVLANLVLSVNRWRLEEKNAAETQMELADTAIYKAQDEGRKDERYARAENLKTQYEKDFEAGDFKMAKEKAKDAIFEADNAKQQNEPSNESELVNILLKTGPIWEQTAPRIASDNVIKSVARIQPNLFLKQYERKLSKIDTYIIRPLKKAGLMYLTLTIIIGVVMLQAWQAFFPRITDFGASSIDFVTAFLYGFSGQAFLSEFADLGKRWLV